MVTCRFISKEMLDFHGEHHDSTFMGQIVVDALGINGECDMFFKSLVHSDCYAVGWVTKDGEAESEMVPYERIIDAVRKLNYAVKE